MQSGLTKRADIQAASSTTVQFSASTQLADRPIRLWAKSGRVAIVTALPTALTISGGAGTKYVYAVLAAPSGSAYSTASGGLLDKIKNALPWNRADWYEAMRTNHPGDGTFIDAARNSVVTLEFTTSAAPADAHRVPLGELEWDGSAITSLVSYENQISVTVSALINGQCRLTKSGSNLLLSPYNGNSLIINGTPRAVPAAGISLSASGLTPSTNYYIYASWSGSAIVLEASTTTHATDSGNGTEIKSGDGTRALVGFARVVTGPAWFDDSANKRFVLSWFNRRSLSCHGNFSANRTTTSATYVEINTEIRVEVLTWADETIMVTTAGSVEHSGTQDTSIGLAFDGTSPAAAMALQNGGSDPAPLAITYHTAAASEGYHFVTLVGSIGGGNTLTFHSTDTAAATAKCRIIAVIRG